MKKIIKYLLLAILLTVTIVLAVAWLKRDSLIDFARKEISTTLSKLTGNQVTIGELTFKLFPKPAVIARDTSISGQSSCPLILAQKLKLTFDLSELLQGTATPAGLKIIGLQAEISRNEDRLNFKIPGQRCQGQLFNKQEIPAATKASADKPVKKKSSPPDAKSYHDISIRIEDSNLIWSAKKRMTLNRLDLNLTYAGNQLILKNIDTNGKLDNQEYGFNSSLISYDLQKNKIEIKESELKLADSEVNFTAKKASDRLQASLTTEAFELSEINLLLGLLNFAPDFSLTGKTSGNLKILSENGITTTSGKLKTASLSGQIGSFKFDSVSESKIDFKHQDQTELIFKIPELKFNTTPGSYSFKNLDGKVLINNNGSLRISGQSKVGQFNLRTPEYKIEDVRGLIKDFSYKSENGLNLSGIIEAQSIKYDSKGVKVSSATKLNLPLQMYFPSQGGYNIKSQAEVSGLNLSSGNQDFKDISGKITALIDSSLSEYSSESLNFNYNQLPLTVRSKITKQNEQIQFLEGEIFFNPGSFKFNGNINNRTNNFTLKSDIKDLAIDKALKAFGSITDNQSQIKTAVLELAGNFQDLNSLKGQGNFVLFFPNLLKSKIVEGIFKAASTLSLIGLIKTDSATNADNQHAGNVIGEFKIADSKVILDKVRADAKRYNVNLSGKVGFDSSLDGNAEAVFLQENLQLLGLNIDQLKKILNHGRLIIPVKISGVISVPKIEVDYLRLPSAIPGLNIVESLAGAGKDAGKEIFDIIKSPFKGKDKPQEQQVTPANTPQVSPAPVTSPQESAKKPGKKKTNPKK